ncbi:MAG: hypothetical protein AAFO75_12460, partial [Pseudomonadota bacterium]
RSAPDGGHLAEHADPDGRSLLVGANTTTCMGPVKLIKRSKHAEKPGVTAGSRSNRSWTNHICWMRCDHDVLLPHPRNTAGNSSTSRQIFLIS